VRAAGSAGEQESAPRGRHARVHVGRSSSRPRLCQGTNCPCPGTSAGAIPSQLMVVCQVTLHGTPHWARCSVALRGGTRRGFCAPLLRRPSISPRGSCSAGSGAPKRRGAESYRAAASGPFSASAAASEIGCGGQLGPAAAASIATPLDRTRPGRERRRGALSAAEALVCVSGTEPFQAAAHIRGASPQRWRASRWSCARLAAAI
jgi:hypothetical protein